jgi:hypothetical protein
MNKKTNKASEPARQACLCQGAGPALTELLRRVGPPEGAREHFAAARLEFLKGLRAMLDTRIEQCAKGGRKGQKIAVD